MTAAASANGKTTLEDDCWTEKLVEAATEVFSTMVGAELTEPEKASPVASEVSAMIGLGGAICGVLTLCCSSAAANALASHMLGVAPETITSQSCDAAGEVCNMIAGSLKMRFPDLQDKCMLSVPTVITGEDYQLHPLEVKRRFDLRFRFDDQPLYLTLELRN